MITNSPYISVDTIILYNKGVILIKRKNPPLGWALPGGFVEYNETLEQAAIREAKEETNLDITLIKQLHAYSDPNRDPRKHVISIAYLAKGKGKLQAKDDAKQAGVFSLDNIPDLVFDHKKILETALPDIKKNLDS